MSGPPGPSKRPEKPFSADIDVPPSRAPGEPPRTFELIGRLVLRTSCVARLGPGPQRPPGARPGTRKSSRGATVARANFRFLTDLDEPRRPSNPFQALAHLPEVLPLPSEPDSTRPGVARSGKRPYRSRNRRFWARNR